jgi:hypothetical protein
MVHYTASTEIEDLMDITDESHSSSTTTSTTSLPLRVRRKLNGLSLLRVTQPETRHKEILLSLEAKDHLIRKKEGTRRLKRNVVNRHCKAMKYIKTVNTAVTAAGGLGTPLQHLSSDLESVTL